MHRLPLEKVWMSDGEYRAGIVQRSMRLSCERIRICIDKDLQKVSNKPATACVPLSDFRAKVLSDEYVVRHVKSAHPNRNPGCEYDVRGLRIGPDIEFSNWRYITGGCTAAED